MLRPGLSPEFRLLIDCSASGPAAAGTALSVPDGINWAVFLGLVERHRIAPAVCQRLSADNTPGPPRAVLDQLRERARRASVRALRHAAAAIELVRVFQQHGLDVLPLKGALLSRRLFGDPGIREVRDVDMLIRPSGLAAADRLLRQRGFERRFPEVEPTPRMLAALLEREQHFEYRQARTGVEVELHWQLESWDAPRIDWLWRHSQSRPGPGGAVRELDEPALLLLVVDHGARHKWFCLKWLADAAVLFARTTEAGSVPLIEAAGQLDLVRPLAQAALLVHRLYGLGLARPWLELIRREPIVQRLAGEALQALLGSERDHFRGQAGWRWLRNRRYARNLRCRAGRPPQARHLLRARDFDQVRLPDSLFWLYYPLRPLLWLCRNVIG
jgi:hypothetical protein